MPTAKGTKQIFRMVKETTYGVAPTTPTMFKIPISEQGVGGDIFKQNLLPNPEMTGVRSPSAPVLGNRSVSFDIPATLHLDSIGHLLYHAVGVPATTGSAPWTHVGKVDYNNGSVGDLPVGFTAEVGYPDVTVFLPVYGCKINTMRVSGQSEGVAMLNFGVIGQDFGTPAAATLANSTTEFTSDVVGHFSGSIEEGGSSIAIVTSVDFTLNNALDSSLYTFGGAGTFAELPEGKAAVTGTVTALFQNSTLLNKAINGTESSLMVKWTAGSYSLQFDIPELRYEPKAPTASGDRGVLITLPFIAYAADHADDSVLKYTLINDVSSY